MLGCPLTAGYILDFRDTRFPALNAGHIHLLRVLIGSLFCSRLLWLARVVLVLRHFIENHSLPVLIACVAGA